MILEFKNVLDLDAEGAIECCDNVNVLEYRPFAQLGLTAAEDRFVWGSLMTEESQRAEAGLGGENPVLRK